MRSGVTGLAGRQQAATVAGRAGAGTGWSCLLDGDSGLRILEHHAGSAHTTLPNMRVSQLKQGRSTPPRYRVHACTLGNRRALCRDRPAAGKGAGPLGEGPLASLAGRKTGPTLHRPRSACRILSTTCLLLTPLQRNPRALPASMPSCAWVAWFKVCWAPGAQTTSGAAGSSSDRPAPSPVPRAPSNLALPPRYSIQPCRSRLLVPCAEAAYLT